MSIFNKINEVLIVDTFKEESVKNLCREVNET